MGSHLWHLESGKVMNREANNKLFAKLYNYSGNYIKIAYIATDFLSLRGITGRLFYGMPP